MSKRLARLIIRLFLLASFAALTLILFYGALDKLETAFMVSVVSMIATEIALNAMDGSRFAPIQVQGQKQKRKDWRALAASVSFFVAAFADYRSDILAFHRVTDMAPMCGTVRMPDGTVAHFEGGCEKIMSQAELIYGLSSLGFFSLTIILLSLMYVKPLK